MQASTNASLARQIPTSVKLPTSLTAAVNSTTGNLSQMNLQQRQQSLRVQSLEMEREQLRLRQQEIMRQVVALLPMGKYSLFIRVLYKNIFYSLFLHNTSFLTALK